MKKNKECFMRTDTSNMLEELKKIIVEDLPNEEKIKKIKKVFNVSEEDKYAYMLTAYKNIDTLMPSKNIDTSAECRCCNLTRIDIHSCDFEDPECNIDCHDIPVFITRIDEKVTIHLIDASINTVSDIYFVVDKQMESMDARDMYLFLMANMTEEQTTKDGCV
jgi:hypothetical protein